MVSFYIVKSGISDKVTTRLIGGNVMLSAKFIAENTPNSGDSLRMDCVECGGKSTFTISNLDGTVIWNCYKASCKVGGSTRVGVRAADVLRRSEQAMNAEAFKLPAQIVSPTAEVHKFAERWKLSVDRLDLRYACIDSRVVFPIRRKGVVVDAIGRSLWANSPMKWKRYGKEKYPYVHGAGDVVVLVEDAISAAVVSELDRCIGVAILGTTVSRECKCFVGDFTNIIIALDPDARSKALTIRKELDARHTCTVISLRDDLKYRDHIDLNLIRRKVDES